MREPCRRCEGTEGRAERVHGRDQVYCVSCGAWAYAARADDARALREAVGKVRALDAEFVEKIESPNT